jgi:hypothetical protein
MKIKLYILLIVFSLSSLVTMAAAITPIGEQSASEQETPADTIIFKTHIENKEYQVWLDIDFYKQDIIIPGQEIFGEVPGYLGAKRDTRKWIIVDLGIKGNVATLDIINDYGSEDLEASLTYNGDGTYTFKQIKGSTIEIVVNNKWVKLPQKMIFKK